MAAGQTGAGSIDGPFGWDRPLMEGLERLLAGLAADRPSPGGGAAALVAAAMGEAILAKAARVSARHAAARDLDGVQAAVGEDPAALTAAANRSEQEARTLLAMAPRDGAAFEEYLAALRLPRETAGERITRRAALDSASHAACTLGLEAVTVLGEALARATTLEPQVTDAIRPDVRAARALLAVGMETTLDNAQANARTETDRTRVAEARRRSAPKTGAEWAG